MTLLTKGGRLAVIGGALKRFVAGCIDSCCVRWYCHLPDYECDKNAVAYISEHATQEECLRQCGDGVEHYCHPDYSCDTDPTNALASYPSKQLCEANCRSDYQWYCCYKSTDFTRGSECQQGECLDPGLVRSGPYENKPECDVSCEPQYYCVLLEGQDGTAPEDYECVVEPGNRLIVAGPTTQSACELTCSTYRRTIWCVQNAYCTYAYNGPPFFCTVFPTFCEEYDTLAECQQFCYPDKWYCVQPGQPCEQLPNPPTPDAKAYSSKTLCEQDCDDYYCCWVSTDPARGSYCQIGPCDPGLERSGPHDTKPICERECHRINCWSYNDITTSYRTVKVCQEESPDGCTPNGPGEPPTCIHENVKLETGPYGKESDCVRVCDAPLYRYYCGPNKVCTKCCASGNCAAGDQSCPAGVTLYATASECDNVCNPPPPQRFFCNTNGECTECWDTDANPDNTSTLPACPPGATIYPDLPLCEAMCNPPDPCFTSIQAGGVVVGSVPATVDIYFEMLQDNSGPSVECMWITDGVYRVRGCGCDPTVADIELELGESLFDRYGPVQDYIPAFQAGVPCDVPYTLAKYVIVDNIPCPPKRCPSPEPQANRRYLCTPNNTDPTSPDFPFAQWIAIDPPQCPEPCVDPSSDTLGRCPQEGTVTTSLYRCNQPAAPRPSEVIAVAP